LKKKIFASFFFHSKNRNRYIDVEASLIVTGDKSAVDFPILLKFGTIVHDELHD